MNFANDEGLGPAPSAVHRKVVSALKGDRDALVSLLEDDALDQLLIHHRMGPALFFAANELGIHGKAVDRCQKFNVGSAIRWIRLRAVLSEVGAALDSAGIQWIPLKGLDTAERFFPRPELRPTSDLDVLVPADSLEDAKRVLEGDGWSFPSTILRDRYQRDEGYNWHGCADHGENLELHYRLWGTVPDSLVDACWDTAIPAPELGRYAFRLDPVMGFVISAVHSWIHLGRPQLIYWWEMSLISKQLENAQVVAQAARQHGLEFPVGLTAEYVGRLWQQPECTKLGQKLLAEIRLPERLALRTVQRRGIDALTLELLFVTRLLSRRPSRMGFKSVVRRIWPHPGVVEDSTPADLPWWRRRVIAASRNVPRIKSPGKPDDTAHER